MKRDHAAEARRPSETLLPQRLYRAEQGDLPDLRSQLEAARNFLAEHHNHRSRDVKPPGSNAHVIPLLSHWRANVRRADMWQEAAPAHR